MTCIEKRWPEERREVLRMSPKVTVLMPVRNGEAYLREAIESVLSQLEGEK